MIIMYNNYGNNLYRMRVQTIIYKYRHCFNNLVLLVYNNNIMRVQLLSDIVHFNTIPSGCKLHVMITAKMTNLES